MESLSSGVTSETAGKVHHQCAMHIVHVAHKNYLNGWLRGGALCLRVESSFPQRFNSSQGVWTDLISIVSLLFVCDCIH